MTPRLRATYFDVANHGWAVTRHGLLRCADDIYPRYTSAQTTDIDLRSPLSHDTIRRFREFDIVIAQNMANEIADSQQALNNLVNALTSLRTGALVVLSDQRGYAVAAKKLEEGLTRRLQPHFEVAHDAMLSSQQPQLCEQFSAPNFPLLDRNFFSPDPNMKLRARINMNVVEWTAKRPERRTDDE